MELLTNILRATAFLLNICGAIVVLYGSLWAFFRWLSDELQQHVPWHKAIDAIRSRYSRFLILGLEFLIGGDIIRTVNTREWQDLVMLGAFIVLRVLLGVTLLKDVQEHSAVALPMRRK